jgi:glutamate-ammonia-ligase adenylyltransferase
MANDPHQWLSSAEAEDALEALEAAGEVLQNDEQRMGAAAIAVHAPSLWPLLLSNPALLQGALGTPLHLAWERHSLADRFSHALKCVGNERELRRTLRHLRHQALIRIAIRESLRLADVEQSSAEMSALADVAVESALRAALQLYSEKFGTPQDTQGKPVSLAAIGMGKLGGSELNLGSDIDLCFFYQTDDAIVPKAAITVHDFYTRVVRHTCQTLSEITEDGFCFRVDLRLRPEGRTGPLVNSLSSAERYYESWGRTWERAALIRARPIAGDLDFGDSLLRALEPFIYRRTVNPSIASEMASMLERSRRELDVDASRDVKLGAGGIREAEFFLQSLQLIWGGVHPQVRTAGTIDALTALRACGLISDRESERFTQAWTFLRRLEHAIHLRRGYQTHLMPDSEEQLQQLAASLGFLHSDDLLSHLQQQRNAVQALFSTLQPTQASSVEPLAVLRDLICDEAPVEAIRAQLSRSMQVSDADEALAHLRQLGKHADFPLGNATRDRHPELGLTLLQEVRDCSDPLSALHLLVELFNRLGQPWAYGQWLTTTPLLLRRLMTLFANSPTLSSQLVAHPEIIDVVLADQDPITEETIQTSHQALKSQMDTHDIESVVSLLRGLKRDCVLRIGLLFVNNDIDTTQAGALLSCLAEEQVRLALEAAMHTCLPGDSPAWPEPIVCALGKLGGRELGFASDLDLFFLYDEHALNPSQAPSAVEVYSRVAQRTLRLLSQLDAEGPGYELDTRLRPSGRQGLLVVSTDAFEDYHAKRAAAWERQALIRARAINGSETVRERINTQIKRIAFEGNPASAAECSRLRSRMQAELAVESANRYDLKYGYGGLVELEFVVQWLQMNHGRDPRLQLANTYDALVVLGDATHLSTNETQGLKEAYQWFRRLEQFLQLMKPHAQASFSAHEPMLDKLAFVLRVRPRDGSSGGEALIKTYQRHAHTVRSIFNAHLEPLSQPAPWGTS